MQLITILFPLLVAVTVFFGVIMTIWWYWRKATAPEGESAPEWGDIRSLRVAMNSTPIIMRMIMVAIIAGAMAIPMEYIYDLTMERYGRYKSVVTEISSSWGSGQTITGPVLHVPYTVKYESVKSVPMSSAEIMIEQSNGSSRTTKDVIQKHVEEYAAMILPDDLSIDCGASTEARYRSIYTARVYTAAAKVSGNFSKRNLTELRRNISEVHWDKTLFVVGITNTKGIRGISELKIAGTKHKFLPGTGGIKVLPTGFSVPCDLAKPAEGGKFAFDFEVSIGGSDGFFLTPIGMSSAFTLSSDWAHPNFTGSGLPASREISAKGFSAVWNVPNLVRNYPQVDDMKYWNVPDSSRTDTKNSPWHNFSEYVVGVEFAEPVFHYTLLMRITKYGLLFIALTFLGVVIFENYYSRRGGVKLSVVQYVVIGAALSLFYLTLLAASEHVGFTKAYMIAAAQAVVMTGGYVAAAMRSFRPVMMIVVVQSLLYALLFFILRMEDYALLAGTALLVASTAALMAATGGINRQKSNAQPKK